MLRASPSRCGALSCPAGPPPSRGTQLEHGCRSAKLACVNKDHRSERLIHCETNAVAGGLTTGFLESAALGKPSSQFPLLGAIPSDLPPNVMNSDKRLLDRAILLFAAIVVFGAPA